MVRVLKLGDDLAPEFKLCDHLLAVAMLSSSGKLSAVSHTSPAGLSFLQSGAGWRVSGSHWPHLEVQLWQSFSLPELDQALMHMFPSLLQRETISPILQHLQLRPKH